MKQPPVTIFGGSKLPQDSSYREQAQLLAQSLTNEDIPVLLGGASTYLEKRCYHMHHHKHTIESVMSINVKSSQNQENSCLHTDMMLTHFSSRKWILISYSAGFIVFPGGFGTLSELTQLLTLIQTNMRKKAPIILIGVVYWEPFLMWLREKVLAERLIEPEHMQLLEVTDSLEEAITIIKKSYSKEFAIT